MESAASTFTQKGKFQLREGSIPLTLNALKQLAQALDGYPGRKNLIWLSEAFPVDLFPEGLERSGFNNNLNNVGRTTPTNQASDPAGAARSEGVQASVQGSGPVSHAPGMSTDWAAELEKVANALMNAQVAVYPIDAAGVGVADRLLAQTTMQSLAERTGGRAFINRNSMKQDIRASIDDGSSYYTLEYYPENKQWDGTFRNIAVKTTRSGVNLRYRLGYYALDPAFTAREDWKKVAADFSRAMSPDVPASTGVLFKADVVPPSDKTGNKVVVNFAIDPHSVAFDKKSDGLQHASISCTVWAYPEKGNMVRSDVGTANAALQDEEFRRMMQSNFPCHESLTLKSGKYTLRMGVIDRSTNLMGTASASISVP